MATGVRHFRARTSWPNAGSLTQFLLTRRFRNVIATPLVVELGEAVPGPIRIIRSLVCQNIVSRNGDIVASKKTRNAKRIRIPDSVPNNDTILELLVIQTAIATPTGHVATHNNLRATKTSDAAIHGR